MQIWAYHSPEGGLPLTGGPGMLVYREDVGDRVGPDADIAIPGTHPPAGLLGVL